MKIYEPYYDEASGIYHDPAGMRLERVTDILQGELSGFDGFPESAAMRGHDVHVAIQYWNEGDLNETTLTDEVAGYLKCFKQAKETHAIKILQNEVMRYHPKYLYAGRCDAIIEIGGIKGILDYKSGTPDKRDRWQIAAYLEFLKAEIPGLKGRWNLYLKPGEYDNDCGFKLVEHTGKRDFAEFLALFAAYQIKKMNGYIKEKRKL